MNIQKYVSENMCSSEKIFEIILLRDTWKLAENEKCSCSGFVLQYEGHCCCGRRMHKEEAKAKLIRFIMEL